MAHIYERIGLIGDIHAEDERLERALDILEARGVDMVVATGDIVDGFGSAERCCRILQSRNVVAVRGNHDRWLLAGTARDLPEATPVASITDSSRKWLAELPGWLEFNTPQGLALLCHGLGPNDMAKVNPDDFGYALQVNDDLQNLLSSAYYRWILNGHSHRRMVRHFGRMTIVNAGTLYREHSSCFLELDFRVPHALVFEIAEDGAVGREPKSIALEDRRTSI